MTNGDTDVPADGGSAIAPDTEATRTHHVIAGFDGSDSSYAALKVARLITPPGHLHVVFVGHLPVTDGYSAQAFAAASDNLEEMARDLAEAARSALDMSAVDWTFQERHGNVAHELINFARELIDLEQSEIIIVVGSADHLYDRIRGSVPQHLARQNEYQVVIVPSRAIVHRDTGD